MARGRFSNYNLDDLLNVTLGSSICGPFERYFGEFLPTTSN